MKANVQIPLCTNCGEPMKLVRVTPRFGGLPELQTFACQPCGSVVTKPIDAPSPRSD